jgi:3-methyladenine DNA glycosylase/8-oxoguanine DNA glycosylase
MVPDAVRAVSVPKAFRLDISVGPAAWVGERSPRHAWIDDSLVWCGREGECPVWRRVRQWRPGRLEIEGTAEPALDPEWVANTLHPEAMVEHWDEPLLDEIGARFPGLAPYGDGSLFEGLVTSIVGQSISVAAAAVTQYRLAFLFDPGVEIMGRRFSPLPSAAQLADASVELIRSSGVTTRRAEALKRIGRIAEDGLLPSDDRARNDPDAVERELLDLPLVGPWTAKSTLLWGVGAPDAWPSGDVALLRALKHATGGDDLTLKTMDALAEGWRPHRGIAARLLWANLFDKGSRVGEK